MTTDPDDKRPADPARVSARMSERVAGMTEDERTELALELRRRKAAAALATPTAPEPGVFRRRAPTVPAPADEQEKQRAEQVVRLTAELHRTERKLARLERAATSSRYGGASVPDPARYNRLLSRADRIERQLRALR